jgi:hypothetical protein
MSLCAIIPINLLQAANDSLEQQGYGPLNFSVPLYASGGAAYAGLHAWNDAAFITAVKAIAGVFWEESEGDPTTRFNTLANAYGTKWAGTAPVLPTSGMVAAGALYRNGDDLWQVLQAYDIGVYGGDPNQYPALIRQMREPHKVYPWKQPVDQFDAYKLLNPFTDAPDECTHSGKKWRVVQGDGGGNNTWEPGVFGWVEI